LLNSANVWATSKEELKALYACPYTGAITIRTSLLEGFSHDESIHQYCFFEAGSEGYGPSESKAKYERRTVRETSSLNTLGYSHIPLLDYINMIIDIEAETKASTGGDPKPVIFSVTGSPEDICLCQRHLTLRKPPETTTWRMEINLSCPNIPNEPPPAYARERLKQYLVALQGVIPPLGSVEIGIKTPPYTYQDQFSDLVTALKDSTLSGKPCPISFITATNTLGSCLVIDPSNKEPALSSANGSGIGGLAGAALHPLALGNVRTIRLMLDEHAELKDIDIIGVGGVSDAAGFLRMMAVGASAVGVGTALGTSGLGIFETIWTAVPGHVSIPLV
jgi:dihydroorotate dehydrogenase (fumarate)